MAETKIWEFFVKIFVKFFLLILNFARFSFVLLFIRFRSLKIAVLWYFTPKIDTELAKISNFSFGQRVDSFSECFLRFLKFEK